MIPLLSYPKNLLMINGILPPALWLYIETICWNLRPYSEVSDTMIVYPPQRLFPSTDFYVHTSGFLILEQVFLLLWQYTLTHQCEQHIPTSSPLVVWESVANPHQICNYNVIIVVPTFAVYGRPKCITHCSTYICLKRIRTMTGMYVVCCDI
jgi:hypothetical protein